MPSTPFLAPSIPLPIRVAHPTRPELEYLDDAYFKLLVRCGYEGLYLQDSPFDALTGNHGAFKKVFHLISLYDLAAAYDRERYVAYVRAVCQRAAGYGLKVYLCCWEPRLPYEAWGHTPASWRGRGGFTYDGHNNMTSFCWSEPDAVAYWKQLAHAAFAAVPELAGVHLGVVDNEANFCDTSCPKCKGQTKARQLEDIYQTFAEVKRGRPGFRIVIYDWWLPSDLLQRLPGIVGSDALVIGRSSQGHTQPPLTGGVEDMTQIYGHCGPSILAQKERVDQLGLRLVDMPAWSHPNEAFWLPAAPDPAYAIEKLNALQALGAVGWYDFDCGATEPGSIADAIAAWTAAPTRAPAALVDEVLRGIWGAHSDAAAPAYAHFRAAKLHYPLAYHDPVFPGFSGRSLGLGLTLLGPYVFDDLRGVDTGHGFNWFAPFNFGIPSVVAAVLPRLEAVVAGMAQAEAAIATVPCPTPAAQWERDVFTIFHCYYRAERNYLRFAAAKLDWLTTKDAATLATRVRAVGQDETANLAVVEAWVARHPGQLSNPCHDLLGWLEETWPAHRFQPDLLAPKRASLQALCAFSLQPPRPAITPRPRYWKG